MAAKQNDAELIVACKKGEAWAWDAVVERYKRLVYSVPLRAGLSEDDAADVFQTVFTRLLEHLNTIREPQALAAWLLTTAKRESWRTSQKRRRELAQDIPASEADVASAWLNGEHPDEHRWIDQSLMRDALEQVGDRCQKLLWMLYYDPEEPSYEEIGRRLKMPLGSVGPTRARCLQKMQKILRRMGMGQA